MLIIKQLPLCSLDHQKAFFGPVYCFLSITLVYSYDIQKFFFTHRICSKVLTRKLDIYSFGVVLMEIVTGSKAFVDGREEPNLVNYINKVQKETAGFNEFFASVIDKRCPNDGGM